MRCEKEPRRSLGVHDADRPARGGVPGAAPALRRAGRGADPRPARCRGQPLARGRRGADGTARRAPHLCRRRRQAPASCVLLLRLRRRRWRSRCKPTSWTPRPRSNSCTPSPSSTTTSWTAPIRAGAADAVHRDFARHHGGANWRGEPRRFGEGMAILVGDFAVVYADHLDARRAAGGAGGLRRAAHRALRRPVARSHGHRGREHRSRGRGPYRALQIGQVHRRATAAPRRRARRTVRRPRGPALRGRPAARPGIPAARRRARRVRRQRR